tara:strand:+ start:68 stop:373 length:306 start_codon:yes stop_codon:yes gene_type:complete
MEFEQNTILFDDYKIVVLSDTDTNDTNLDEYADSEWLLEPEADIYSDNHPWDSRTNFVQYLQNTQKLDQDILRYIPKKYKHRTSTAYNSTFISTGDRFTPV